MDSCDDNESVNYSSHSDESKQICLSKIRQSPCTLGVHHSHNKSQLMSVHAAPVKLPQHSMSIAASPITASTTINSIAMNNLNVENDFVTVTAIGATRCTRSASASPNITATLNAPAYMHRLPSTSKHLLDLNSSLSIDCSQTNGMHDIVDYDNTMNVAVHNRRLRLLTYGNHKNGMVRHETKL